MIIKIFKISTKELYTFHNKTELISYIRNVTGIPVFRNITIPQLLEYLPKENYCRID